MNCPSHAVTTLLESQNCSKYGVYKGHVVWITKENAIIQWHLYTKRDKLHIFFS